MRLSLQVSRSDAVVAGEECIPACESQTAGRAPDRIGIDKDSTVVEEAAEALPVIEAVGEALGALRALEYRGKAYFEPRLQGLDHGFGALLTDGAADLRQQVADFGLDVVVLGGVPGRGEVLPDACGVSLVAIGELPPT
jgi:hypothetical protein